MWARLLAQALSPLDLALELVLVGLVLRRLRRRRAAAVAIGLGVSVLWLGSTPLVADALLATLEERHAYVSPEAAPDADAIVVLGGVVAPEGPNRPVADLSGSVDRLLHAARLYRAGKAPLVLATGGSAPGTNPRRPEGDAMADLLAEWGVPRDALLVEGGSLDTHQNAVETKRLLDARGLSRVLLVTSASHMSRAAAAFRAVGLSCVPCPTDFVAGDGGGFWGWVPDVGALGKTSRVVHEWIGGLWYRLRGWA
jgi:uncharacterized SAM-binding protein YcdF (DUF218 family)